MSTVIVGLFEGVETAARAGRALKELSLPAGSVTTISAVPLPDGAVVTDTAPIRFPKIVIAGWFVGAAAGLGLTLATYMLYPLVTGGKTIVSVPPTLIITYEVAMLGALLGTLFGSGREMGLLRFPPKMIHDPRIHDGKIALCARVDGDEQARRTIEAMREAGGIEVRAEEGE
ncbi:MAG TPA: quinol:electron acceptor oxidoreductase subunit ActD, partial [Candidatus Deferrimicrobium sp.]|nr:quinol:electron acceptor oxidoreductase subunit ActD [Candidatus Deferrimicrobium sp.]